MSDEPATFNQTTGTDEIRDLTDVFTEAGLGTIAHELNAISSQLDKVFAQTTWLCAMVSAIRMTLPPPMQQALDQAFHQIQAGANHHGG